MTHAVGPESAIPPVLEDDDDDVAWALQTAQVQWSRRAYGDALSWLERAVSNAEEVGATERAQQLRVFAASLTQHMWDKTAEALPVRRSSVPDTEALESLDDDVEMDEEEAEAPEVEASELRAAEEVEAEVEASELRAAEEVEAEVEEIEPTGESQEYTYVPTFTADPDPDSLQLPSPSELSQPVNEPFGVPIARFTTDTPPEFAEAALDTSPEATSPEATSPEATSPEATSPEATSPEASMEAPILDASVEPGEAEIDGVLLVEVRGLQDLPDEAQRRLVAQARIVELGPDEEVDDFGAALILRGTVYIMPTLADAACASASVADVVFATGSLNPGIPIRVVGAEAGTKVAVFAREDLRREMAECPWVEEDLRQVADHYQALAGAGMGVMGERLDDALRGMITSRCEVQHYGPNEVVVAEGQAVEALYIVGAGSLVLVDSAGVVTSEAHPGDFVFAPQIMRAGAAPLTAQAGTLGTLLLRTDRRTAHELLLSVPPLLEILAGI